MIMNLFNLVICIAMKRKLPVKRKLFAATKKYKPFIAKSVADFLKYNNIYRFVDKYKDIADVSDIHTIPKADLHKIINFAMDNSKINLLEALSAEGVIFDKQEYLDIAVQKKSLKIVRFLLQHGTNLNKVYALHNAAKNGSLKIVNGLIEDGVDINARLQYKSTSVDHWGIHTSYVLFSALEFALKQAHYKIVFFLIEKGFNVNSKDSAGNLLLTALLFYALGMKNIKDVDLLIEAADDIDFRNQKDFPSAPHIFLKAVTTGRLDIVKSLTKAGMDIDGVDGLSPIKKAAINNFLEIFKYLLEQGANIHDLDGEILPFSEALQTARLVDYVYSSEYSLSIESPLNEKYQHLFINRLENILIKHGIPSSYSLFCQKLKTAIDPFIYEICETKLEFMVEETILFEAILLHQIFPQTFTTPASLYSCIKTSTLYDNNKNIQSLIELYNDNFPALIEVLSPYLEAQMLGEITPKLESNVMLTLKDHAGNLLLKMHSEFPDIALNSQIVSCPTLQDFYYNNLLTEKAQIDYCEFLGEGKEGEEDL